MKLGITLAAVLVVALSASATAKGDGEDAGPAKEKKICRTERATGSLVAKRRVCLTQSQWDELAANARKNVDDYTRRQGRGSESGSGMGANSGF